MLNGVLELAAAGVEITPAAAVFWHLLLHPLDGANPEQIQTTLDYPGRQIAQQ